MSTLRDLKARFPRLYTVATALAAVGAVAGIAAYETRGDCCFEGSPCCHPGAACCHGHGAKLAAKN
jgi:hypothetical protein